MCKVVNGVNLYSYYINDDDFMVFKSVKKTTN